MTRIGTVTIRADVARLSPTVIQEITEGGVNRRAVFVYDRSLVDGGKLWIDVPGNQPITHLRYRRAA